MLLVYKRDGHGIWTLQSLENAKSFKRTHQFLFQTCEAIAHVMIAQFLSVNNSSDLLLVLVVANKLEEMINEKSKLHLI